MKTMGMGAPEMGFKSLVKAVSMKKGLRGKRGCRSK